MKNMIEKISELARLQLAPEERERFAKKLEHILHYVEKLKTLDTSKLEATSHATAQTNAFREDQIISFPHVDKILEVVPQHTEEYFIVPKVIE